MVFIAYDSSLFDTLIPNKRGFKMANLNINSQLKHIAELRVHMNKQQVDILAINEKKMNSDVPLDLISIEGYS